MEGASHVEGPGDEVDDYSLQSYDYRMAMTQLDTPQITEKGLVRVRLGSVLTLKVTQSGGCGSGSGGVN